MFSISGLIVLLLVVGVVLALVPFDATIKRTVVIVVVILLVLVLLRALGMLGVFRGAWI